MAKSEIIKQLARGKVDTELALKQLKLLLTEFPDQKIISWVNNELNGYLMDDRLPEYRKAPGTLIGSFLNYSTKASNIGIPLSLDAPESLLKFCNNVELRESIGELKSLQLHKGGNLGVPVPPDAYPLIIQYSIMSMTAMLSAQVRVSETAISHVFSIVDNKILDVMILLEKEFGNLDELDLDLSSKTKDEINNIQSQISMFIYNDNSVVIGDNNKIRESLISTNAKSR